MAVDGAAFAALWVAPDCYEVVELAMLSVGLQQGLEGWCGEIEFESSRRGRGGSLGSGCLLKRY